MPHCLTRITPGRPVVMSVLGRPAASVSSGRATEWKVPHCLARITPGRPVVVSVLGRPAASGSSSPRQGVGEGPVRRSRRRCRIWAQANNLVPADGRAEGSGICPRRSQVASHHLPPRKSEGSPGCFAPGGRGLSHLGKKFTRASCTVFFLQSLASETTKSKQTGLVPFSKG